MNKMMMSPVLLTSLILTACGAVDNGQTDEFVDVAELAFTGIEDRLNACATAPDS